MVGSDKRIDSNTYWKVVVDLMSKRDRLKVELKSYKRVLNEWENRYKQMEEENEKSLKEIKRNNWCNVCLHKAEEPYQCCRDAHYCGFVHLMGDKTHFIYCKKNKKNEYSPPPPEPHPLYNQIQSQIKNLRRLYNNCIQN